MINYGLRNNLPSNSLYNSQIAAIMFVCCLPFRISSLPGIIAETMQSSTLWLYMFLSVIEAIVFLCIYGFMASGGDERLTLINSSAYKVVIFISMLYLFVKGLIYYSYVSIYITRALYLDVAPMIIIMIFIVPVFYLSLKGARTIGRVCDILAPVVFFLLMLNLVFLDADMDFERNMPILSLPPSEFFSKGMRYGQWLGDMLPLAFIRMQRKKMPYIGISALVIAVLVNVTVMLGIALYGNALSFSTNLLIRIASFSQLSAEIGRMEWTALFAVITMAMVSLGFNFWGVTACSERVFGSKKPMQIIYPIVLIAVMVLLPNTNLLANAATSPLGYLLFGLAVTLPCSMLLLNLIHKKKSDRIFEAATSAVYGGEPQNARLSYKTQALQPQKGTRSNPSDERSLNDALLNNYPKNDEAPAAPQSTEGN